MSKFLDKLISKGIVEGEAYKLEKVRQQITFENNKLKTVKTSQNSGVAIRAVVDGKMGFITSTNLDDVDKVIENAISVARVSDNREFDFSKPLEYENMELKNKKIWEIPEEQLIEDGTRAIEELTKYDKDLMTYISFNKEKTEITIENTNGVNACYEKDVLEVNLFANMIKGTNFIFCGESKSSLSEKYDIREMADRAREKVNILKVTATFLPGNKSVILTPDAMSMILLTLHQGINGSMIEKGVSPLCGKIGEKIFDDRITIVDDGTLKGGVNSMPFDDEGTPSNKTILFENGILKSYIHSLRTANKLGQTPTGNGLKHAGLIPSKVLDAMQRPNVTNWIMEPGNIPYEDMIKDIKDGVIIDDIMGIFMNNLLNGDFSGNIGIGYAIKDGKIVGRVKDAAINANIYDLFKNNIVGLSDKVYNAQGHFLPYAMLKDVYIAGKK